MKPYYMGVFNYNYINLFIWKNISCSDECQSKDWEELLGFQFDFIRLVTHFKPPFSRIIMIILSYVFYCNYLESIFVLHFVYIHPNLNTPENLIVVYFCSLAEKTRIAVQRISEFLLFSY